MYLIKSNKLFKILYPGRIWNIPSPADKVMYLTFDDGPHPVATRFAIDTLKTFDAKATFFCLGKNITMQPALFHELKAAGHAVGNHTYDHVNGWKTKTANYIADISKTQELTKSNLFRPPYGRMSKKQQWALKRQFPDMKIVMWELLSGDFDTKISPEKCWHNVKKHARSGSIIVFHDSAKALDRMKFALTQTLTYFKEKGYVFRALPM